MTHLEFPICSLSECARLTGSLSPNLKQGRLKKNEKVVSHTERHDGTMNWQGEKQLQNPSPPTTDMFQFAILKLHFCWHTWLASGGLQAVGCCWETSRLKKKCAICSWVISERPIQAHTYIELDWRGGTSSSVPVYMAVSKNCIQVSYVLVIMPATHVDPTNTSTGQKRRVWRKTAETNKRARTGV